MELGLTLNPRWFHPVIFNLITSAKSLFSNQVIFTVTGGEDVDVSFGADAIQPTTTRFCSSSYLQVAALCCFCPFSKGHLYGLLRLTSISKISFLSLPVFGRKHSRIPLLGDKGQAGQPSRHGTLQALNSHVFANPEGTGWQSDGVPRQAVAFCLYTFWEHLNMHGKQLTMTDTKEMGKGQLWRKEMPQNPPDFSSILCRKMW